MEPEAQARKKIDQMLSKSGWIIQDYGDLNLGTGKGIAVREYPLGKDNADYALFIDRNPVGVVEAKRAGHTLSGVTEQSEKYLTGLYEKFPNSPRKPPFSYETTGIETLFADRREPNYRSRHVFTFHTPEELSSWLREEKSLRTRLKEIPPLNYQNLWDCQKQAVRNLEESFAANRPRALIQMATGSGKTFTAVTFAYRLIKHAGAKRILFLVDRGNLSRQAYREFQQYVTPDDGRKFTELYNVQQLQSQTIDPVAKVVISTVQRMYSILQGEPEFDETKEEFSEFEKRISEEPLDVEYNQNIPINEFDFIVIDECHRSIYNRWKQVLDYFDSFLIGLTATPSKHTIGFFNNNQVMAYTHERAIADGVNVGYHVYRIRTGITEEGGLLPAGEIIEKRDRLTRIEQAEKLDEDVVFAPNQLDRDVVVKDQIRLVIRTFRDKLSEIFPNRTVVPKTLVFAKDDSHAEDITEIMREEFHEGNDFCKKITYKTTGEKPEDIIASFRNSTYPRIAVTVDMIATGTDIRPLECILFMRDVRSKLYFDQMKGRGTRTIKPDDLMSVTPDAKSKDHFVIVDAVGVCEHAMSDTHSLNRNLGASFEQLLQATAEGRAGADEIESLAYRLSRLDRKLDKKEKEEIIKVSGGLTIPQLVNKLLDGIDSDNQVTLAKQKFKTDEPTKQQIDQVAKESILEVSKLFDSAKMRQTILDVKKRNEQIIDRISIDKLIDAGFVKEAKEHSEKVVENFKEFIEKNKDELLALQILYSKPYKIRELTFNDIKEIASKIETPPYNLTPEDLWSAYQQLEKSKVKDNPRKTLTDLISIIRFAVGKEEILTPFDEKVTQKFEKWLMEQEKSGRKFTLEQKEWLVMIKDQIATSITASLEDMDDIPFSQKGGRIKLYKLFGDDYEKLLQELHEVLISI
ncbi:type I restriction endonuclease subunit R [Candidatus Nitrosotenuis sp. DW1]|uniref:type I restriction endonuclease subunit R n=1 Tax=Candidatus Nitrosotenuis sp. DW1 TaxID=2259672 RepID=UPI0015CA4123|nr:type I restriction-modification enzyme R subunit C-terminal domain-containing protein [Candidatus Nitrosotenuis sp. DW1]QLH09465.1 restriction endonuclease subunit R [Candidatus Nitrosotenuis sp. DW1]